MNKTLRSVILLAFLAAASLVAVPLYAYDNCDNVEGQTCSPRGSITYCYRVVIEGEPYYWYRCGCDFDYFGQLRWSCVFLGEGSFTREELRAATCSNEIPPGHGARGAARE